MSEVPSLPVSEWLQSIKLDQYSDVFEKHDIRTVSDVQHLSDEFLSSIGIYLPGHRKRILASLQKSISPDPSLETSTFRPVPKKRNILPKSVSESSCLNVDPVPNPQPSRTVTSPPPIPPRTGRGPPLKFSMSPPKTVSPVSAPETHESPRSPASPALKSPAFLLPNEDAGFVEDDVSKGEVPILAPPLPQKRHKMENKSITGSPPPLPARPIKTAPPPPISPLPALDESKVDEGHMFPFYPIPKPFPRVISRDPPLTPVLRPPRDNPQKPETRLPDPGNIYELSRDIGGIVLTGYRQLNANIADTNDDKTEMGDDDYEDIESVQADGGLSASPSLGISGGNMDGGEWSTQQTAVIKAGWLDKNPPQGSYIFQRRWVKLEADYLRYYDSDKDIYSKRIIKTSCINKVASTGDQKFEVATSNRNFVFRAESDSDRNDWIKAIQQVLEERRSRPASSSVCNPENVDKCGLLEMKGWKPKMFVVVATDKVFLYKNGEDFVSGVGVTSIDMNLGNVKEMDKRSFDLTTPYKTFSFIADNEQERSEWVEAMMQSVAGALSNLEVAQKIWSVESNRLCADCGAPTPDWASVNLCVVICKKCAGQHRSLGPSISKVRSLKMDHKIWTEELIELFLKLCNEVSNKFWAANVPPSEAIDQWSSSLERKTYISAKYREGKYRRYHQLFGNQVELNKALCVSVATTDLTETQALVFCGADISCTCGELFFSQPLELALQAGQKLQEEFLKQNRTSEIPRLDLGANLEKQYYVMHHSITHNGYLYKTSSMTRLVADRKAKEEFSRRWCVLNDGTLSYYENNHSSTPNGEIRMDEIVCVAVIPPDTHGYESTFEIYTKSERLYLFAADTPEEAREWVKSITKCFLPLKAEELLSYDFDRIGRLQFKGGRSLERTRVGWFSLCKTYLYTYVEDNETVEVINLRKLVELSTKDKDILVLVEKGRITYILAERKLDFAGWAAAIQKASSTSGDTLSEQQLTDSDVPCIVEKCIDHISSFGVGSEGIYRKSGQNSKITSLLEALKKDARSVVLTEEEHVDNVSDALKRFFRGIGEGVFAEHCMQWLHVTGIEDESERILKYQELLQSLPPVNRATLKALVRHLYCIKHFSDLNQMSIHNLAIVFGPTLFQTDGQNYKPGRVVEDLISLYLPIFSVDIQEIQKQLDITSTIMKVRNENQVRRRGCDFICTVYLMEKKAECEQSVHIAVTMTAQELTETLLERRNIRIMEGDYWRCSEVDDSGEIERPLHYSEKVLPIFHSQVNNSSHLIVKKDLHMDAMLYYIKNRVGESKNGMMKFREEKSLLGFGASFHDRYFMLNSTMLRMYREVRSSMEQRYSLESRSESHRPEKEWPVKNLTVHLGIRKKVRAPTSWGFTIMCKNEKNEKSQWYLCCESVTDMREWFAAFMFVQYGSLWPEQSSLVRTRSSHLESTFGNLSLIPIRGSETDIRRSMAAFTTDPLTLLGNV
ncbi:arf-GAP with Rho-GAP domain, ANK repeat and PH domain-containing protein 1 isoform X1 [Bufo gargarizans]|uniref:arf-GAP with Rho-GAP domain, ANK repeat and PH domain-containing protein 1 isoform X1 n=1 Tax=Bufo gargarizans TaxID=30331 RepID=UPI001CF2D6EF|nr:arf-GAP with Rho-GAP domain, ANK repeat and PH domain-containing protein 1 isoform X1 [Bufo gargarizans]XP_044143303.1 arf-GAP with Rho-GAP domain, ANK repeat and PH domain-containing protein 1 isoform X1 [Bufo gargarizans]